MYKKILTLATIGAALLLASPAQAYQEVVNLRLGQLEVRGQNQLLNIGQQLRSRGYSLIGKEVVSVTVNAVSRVGLRTNQYGTLSLRSGFNTTYPQTVYGDRHAYQSPRSLDFQQVTLYTPYSRTASNSQVSLVVDGPIKLGQIRVVLNNTRRAPVNRTPRGCYTDRHHRTICNGVIIDSGRRDRTRGCTVNRRGQRVCTGNDSRRGNDRTDGRRGNDRRDDSRSDRNRGGSDRGNDRGNDRGRRGGR